MTALQHPATNTHSRQSASINVSALRIIAIYDDEDQIVGVPDRSAVPFKDGKIDHSLIRRVPVLALDRRAFPGQPFHYECTNPHFVSYAPVGYEHLKPIGRIGAKRTADEVQRLIDRHEILADELRDELLDIEFAD